MPTAEHFPKLITPSDAHWMPDLRQVEIGPIMQVPLTALMPGYSPRQHGLDPDHVRRLAESEDPLPPVIVHRPTMRIIDGMHRLGAAGLRGQRLIDARFFDGDESSAFVLAVRANVTHGLPLSLADRKAAASRILSDCPGWSNRAVAHASGLAANTVGQLRGRLTGQGEQLDARVGRDGRTRPVNAAERRAAAARLMTEEPDASLRDIARRAGISPETARRVRAQLSNEPDSSQTSARDTAPVPRRSARPAQNAGHARDPGDLIRSLAADPAVRSTELGRVMLRALTAPLLLDGRSAQLAETLPTYRLGDVVLAAQACAVAWQRFAERLEETSPIGTA